MIIMALIIIGLLLYIIKNSRKENKEGFANASSTFGGMTFTWNEATKKLNITGGDIVLNGTISSSQTNSTIAPTTAPVKTARQKAIEFIRLQANQNISSGSVMAVAGGTILLDLMNKPDGDAQKERLIADTITQQRFT
jgi:hypothetical protein